MLLYFRADESGNKRESLILNHLRNAWIRIVYRDGPTGPTGEVNASCMNAESPLNGQSRDPALLVSLQMSSAINSHRYD